MRITLIFLLPPLQHGFSSLSCVNAAALVWAGEDFSGVRQLSQNSLGAGLGHRAEIT